MVMVKRIKLYKFSIFMSILGSILSGVNYVVFKVPAVGVSFIIVTVACINTIICYKIEKKNNTL